MLQELVTSEWGRVTCSFILSVWNFHTISRLFLQNMLSGVVRNGKQEETGDTLVPSSKIFPTKPFPGLHHQSPEFWAFSSEVGLFYFLFLKFYLFVCLLILLTYNVVFAPGGIGL